MKHDFDKFRKTFDNAKFVLGGYCLGSSYVRWLVGDDNCILIDDDVTAYGIKVYRTLELKSIDASQYSFIAFSQKYYDEFIKYSKDVVMLFPDDFGFYSYLENKYGVDLAKTIRVVDFDYVEETATNSGASRQMGLMDVLFQTDCVCERILDIGCGKGGAMVIMNQFPFERIDGIEISPMISEIAKKNIEALGYQDDSGVFNVSALDFDRYGDYSILYMYDPFKGEVFENVIKKISASVKSGTKLIYANPYMHDMVIANGFRLTNRIDTDFFHRYVNVYEKE